MKLFIYIILLINLNIMLAQTDYDLIIKKGIESYEKGDYDSSIMNFNKIIDSYPFKDELYLYIAQSYVKLENYNMAIESINLGLTNNLINPRLHSLLGNIYFEIEQKELGVLCFYYYLFINPSEKESSENFTKIIEYFARQYAIKIINENKIKPRSSFNFNQYLPTTGTNYSSADYERDLINKYIELNLETALKMIDAYFQKESAELFSNLKLPEVILKDKKPNVINDIYIPLFIDIVQSQHLETFCYFISQSTSNDAATWLNNNPEKIKSFIIWLQGE